MRKSRTDIDNLYVCYCLLKSEASGGWGNERTQQVSETLYGAQEFYERLGAATYGQAFVFGNREAIVRPFIEYEPGFRAALDEHVERYAISDALILSYGILNYFMPQGEENPADDGIKDVYRLVLIADYPLDSNSEAVDMMIDRLNTLKRRCDFKICYLDVDGLERSGNLERMIDANLYLL